MTSLPCNATVVDVWETSLKVVKNNVDGAHWPRYLPKKIRCIGIVNHEGWTGRGVPVRGNKKTTRFGAVCDSAVM